MIVHFFLVVAGQLVAWLLSASAVLNLGDFASTLAGYTSDVAGWIGTLYTDLGSMGAWMPVGLLTGCITVAVASLGVAFAIKVGRMVLSLFTGGGGSAA